MEYGYNKSAIWVSFVKPVNNITDRPYVDAVGIAECDYWHILGAAFVP